MEPGRKNLLLAGLLALLSSVGGLLAFHHLHKQRAEAPAAAGPAAR